jgi:hypothetical protein
MMANSQWPKHVVDTSNNITNVVVLTTAISTHNFAIIVINAQVWVHSQGSLCGIYGNFSDVATLFFESPISAVRCHHYSTNDPHSAFSSICH